jgi:hypothetical protein
MLLPIEYLGEFQVFKISMKLVCSASHHVVLILFWGVGLIGNCPDHNMLVWTGRPSVNEAQNCGKKSIVYSNSSRRDGGKG